MRHAAVVLLLALAPVLAAPAAGDVYVQSPPDRAFTLVMHGTSFNAATYPETPLLEAAVGEMVQFTVAVPPGAEPHTFHLHGHPWFVPSKGAMADTFLLNPADVHSFSVKAGSLAQAAGDWMYHCHFDDHVKHGMWGVFRVYPFATRLAGAAPAFDVELDRLGEGVDGATFEVTLDGMPVAARATPRGDGAYRLETSLDPLARGVLVVTATHALGESVARVGLGGATVPAPTLAHGGHAH